MNSDHLKLCLVTNIPQQPFDTYIKFILTTIKAGVTCVQLRAKNTPHDILLSMAHELKDALTPSNTPLIINDHIDIAKAVDADGVHIGQSDNAPARARDQLGDGKWIGLSIETEDELIQANKLSCIDYIAASAVFPTKTKTNCRNYWGISGLKHIATLSTHPVVAIGGINLENIHAIMACGIAGIAVISAIHEATQPILTTQAFIHAIQGDTPC